MTREQAKTILMLYRPGPQDAEDAEMSEALKMAESDPELLAWLRAHVAAQSRIRDQFRQIEPPKGLRERVLAAPKTLKPRFVFPKQLALAAASVALLLAGLGFWLNTRVDGDAESFAAFRLRMVQFALREYRMDILTNDAAQVRQYLSKSSAPADFELPGPLERAPVKGGAKLTWRGRPVAMVCFESAAKETLYLFVVEENSVQGGKPSGELAEAMDVKSLGTVSWRRGGEVFVLAGQGSSSALKEFLKLSRAASAYWEV